MRWKLLFFSTTTNTEKTTEREREKKKEKKKSEPSTRCHSYNILFAFYTFIILAPMTNILLCFSPEKRPLFLCR